MNLMEYKAHELFKTCEIPSAKGAVCDQVEQVENLIEGLRFPVCIKAQVQAGGRGKAGGIKFADSVEEAKEKTTAVLGMDIKGHIVKKVMIVEKVEIEKELYLSIMLDRLSKCPMIIFSIEGGVDIEETAKNNTNKVVKVAIDPLIGIKDYTVRYLINKTGADSKIYGQLYDFLKKLYAMFLQYDCMLAEINPLVITKKGELKALDGKISIDDNALSRQPDIMEFRNSLKEDELVVKARENRFLYVPCDPDGNIAVMSNGSGMVMSCMDLISKKGMKVGVAFDLGGGATSDRIAKAVEIVLSNTKIDTLFISIFGGITRCDEVAGGVKIAMESQSDGKTVIVRIEGTNKEKGVEIIKTIKGKVLSVDSILEGVEVLYSVRSLQ